MTTPQTPTAVADDLPLSTLIERWQELTQQDIAARYSSGTPLTVAEHLAVLAIGEKIARTVRHMGYVHDAVTAGATWEQVAAALGQTTAQTQRHYGAWAAGQRRLGHHYDLAEVKLGMSQTEYEAARARVPGAEDDGAAALAMAAETLAGDYPTDPDEVPQTALRVADQGTVWLQPGQVRWFTDLLRREAVTCANAHVGTNECGHCGGTGEARRP